MSLSPLGIPRHLCGLAVLLCFTAAAAAQVTTRDDEVGRLLNAWHADGRAAGLGALTYENRDGQHSPLNTAQYPQLQSFRPDAQSGPVQGPAVLLRPQPVVGNCSMAAPATAGGSLPRLYQMDPKGLHFLARQYLGNNLFIYPEHQDYDPGGNGVGGYGDLYPANNACTLISRGSSGSDQPFLHAVLATLAALPPETQDLLVKNSLLMPTVQAVLRQSLKSVRQPGDYFTGAAHPPVFDSSQLDALRMIRRAQAMTPEAIPPLVRIRVLEETGSTAGKDHFEADPALSQQLGDTPVAVARIFRSHAAELDLVVDASQSADLRGRPLQLRWQLLQGDPAAVRIEAEGTRARLRVRRQPAVRTAAGLRSHRIDIGVFADNGLSVSAPAFVTVFQLPNEKHFQDAQGRTAEVHYQTHNPELGLPADLADPRWREAVRAAALPESPGERLLAEQLPPATRQAVQTAWDELRPPARRGRSQTPASAPEGSAKRQRDILSRQADGHSLATALENALDRLASRDALHLDRQAEWLRLAAASPRPGAGAALMEAVDRLVDWGILIRQASGEVTTASARQHLSAAERDALRGLHLTLLSEVLLPRLLERSTSPAWVDPRLTTPKPWRDRHLYGADGRHLGWVRHQARQTARFDAEGRWLPDGPEHPDRARPVQYQKNAQGVLEWRPL